MKGYGDFKRIAVVIIPNEEIYKERCDQQSDDDKSAVSEHQLNEMKGKLNIKIISLKSLKKIIFSLYSELHVAFN